MNQRTLLGRLMSPAGFGLVLLFFLLPFVTVSCGDGTDHGDVTFSAAALAVGGMPDITSPESDPDVAQAAGELVESEVDLEPLALLAACAVIAGMAVGLLRRRRTRHGSAVIAAVVAVALLAGTVARVPGHVREFIATLAGNEPLPDGTTVNTKLAYGFWVVVALLAVLMAANAFAFWRARDEEPEPVVEMEEPEPLRLDELT